MAKAKKKVVEPVVKYVEYTVTDYHNFSHRGSSKEHRKKLGIGDIYVNAAICKSCGWFIRSRNRHDMVTCNCGKVSVDGGSAYIRRSGNPNDYTDVIELFKGVKKSKVFN